MLHIKCITGFRHKSKQQIIHDKIKIYIKKRKQFLLILLIACCQSISFAGENEIIDYVAKDGNNAWSGMVATPNSDHTDGSLATLEAARNKIRSLKVNGELPSPVTVYYTIRFDKKLSLLR